MAGRLYVTINQADSDVATGSYHLQLERTAATVAPKADGDVKVPDFPQTLLDSLPKRVSDPNGAPGDRVNFILIGSDEQVQAALKAAGWVIVDRTRNDAVLRGLLASLSKEA